MLTKSSLLLPLCLVTACAGEDASTTRTTTSPADDIGAAATEGDFTFYALRPDAAGGFLARSLNLDVTRCADGAYAPECHVDDLDLAKLGLDEETAKKVRDAAGRERAIVRGELGAALVASEAWLPVTEAAIQGELVRVTGTGIVCIAAPCPTFHADTLNRKEGRDVAELDFGPSGAAPNQVNAAYALLDKPHGVLVAGKEYLVTGPAGQMPGVQVQQFFLPVAAASDTPAASDATACYVGGCSSEICSDDPEAASPCIYRPEYACYRSAVCERQADLRCGWTPTEELAQCLENGGPAQ